MVGGGFKSTASLATLVNATAGHALEFDDIAAFSGHYANPLTAATLAVGEKLDASGRDVILAWMIGYEVICQTAKPCMDGPRNTLLWSGWFNQGFQPVLGVAAATAKLIGLDVSQTRMALGNAASAMAGVLKNRGSDTKSFTAGSAAMHGIMAAELAELGFTANEDIIDGDDGVARLLGREVGDPEKVLDGLGSWDMATRGSTMRLHASCGAGHWGQDALQQLLRRRPTDPDDIESIEVRLPAFLMPMLPYHQPPDGSGGEVQHRVRPRDHRARRESRAAPVLRRRGEPARAHRTCSRGSGTSRSRATYARVKLESHVVLTLKDGTTAGRIGPAVPRQSAGSAERGRGRRQVPRVRGGPGARSTAPRHHGSLLPPRRSGERARTGRGGGFDHGLASPARHLRIEPMRSTGRLRSD